jgi:anti-sigma factor RsiW
MIDLTCRDAIEFLQRYLDGELTPEEKAAFDEHMAACPACVDYLKTYEETIRLSRAALRCDPVVREEMLEDLVKAIIAAARGQK